MFIRRLAILASLAVTLALPRAYGAETYRLARSGRTGELTLTEVTMKVGGTVTLTGKGAPRELPMSVEARLAYEEKVTDFAPVQKGDAKADAKAASRSFRYYRQAEAAIKIDKGGQKPVLCDDCRLIAAQTSAGTNTLFCPTSPLKREELDLIDVPANTLAIDQLLPVERVAVGATWKQSDEVLQALLGLDMVSLSNVQSVFGQIKDDLAEVTLSGNVQGATSGVTTDIELKARYYFDVKQRRITRFAMLTKEKRGAGQVNPGLDVTAKITLRISQLKESSHLADEALAKLSNVPTPALTSLIYESQRGKFHILYDRRWDLTSSDPTLAVMRLVDRGELVAQCNISPLPPTTSGKETSLAEFQEDVKKSLGKNFGQFVKASQQTGHDNNRVLRVAASGEVSQLPIEWIYYLIANEQGQQVSLAFTLEKSLAKRFNNADEPLVSSLRFNGKPEADAAKPTAAADKPAKKTPPARTAVKPAKDRSSKQ